MDDNGNPLLPDYPTNRINYTNFLIRCPSNCKGLDSTVLGMGIHPRESPICLSAIVDRSVSIYGGLISVGIFPGLRIYAGYEMKMFGIDIKPYNESSKISFVTAKVDNVDMVQRNIRILNSKGEISSRGRLEMRLNGVWGTFCISGSDNLSAVVACRSMGFKDGRWGNYVNNRTQQTIGFCRNYLGENHCGSEKQHIHYYNLRCLKSSVKLYQCYKQLAELTSCNHDMDAILICTNDNYDNPRPLPDGIVKFQDYDISDTTTRGRIEVSYQGKFRTVCAANTNRQAASVLCKIMGYRDGGIINGKGDIGKEMYGAMKCQGNEAQFGKCTRIPCNNDLNLYIECTGNGDPIAAKQTQYKIVNPPALGKLPIPLIEEVNCLTRGNDKNFRGDPGSVYVINCPRGCIKLAEQIPIYGTSIYASSSAVCKAAIHTGLITNELGGIIAVLKTYGLNYYEGSPSNGVVSNSFNDVSKASFSFSKVNSGWLGMNRLFKNQIMQRLQSVVNTVKNVFLNKFNGIANRSFLEFGTSVEPMYQPVYQFFSPGVGYLFSPGKTISTPAGFTTLSRFTVLLTFTMNQFIQGNRQFIFSYSGCFGFNIYIDRDGSLKFGDPCKPENRLGTGVYIAYNDKISIYLTYTNGKATYKIISERELNDQISSGQNPSQPFITREVVFTMTGSSNIGIGRVGSANQETFYGNIDFVFVFNDVIPENQIKQLVVSLIAKNEQNSKANLTAYTIDDPPRICISTCMPSLPPPSAEAGTPPREALADPSILDIKTFNNFATIIANTPSSSTSLNPFSNNPSSSLAIQSAINNINNNPFTTNNIMDSTNIQSKSIDCKSRMIDPELKIAPTKDTIVRLKCPTCVNTDWGVFGTEIYHPESSICRAALHLGILTQEGEILLKVLTDKKEAFNSTMGKGGFKSVTAGSSNLSFTILPAEAYTPITCSTNAMMDKFGSAPKLSRFVVACPSQCSEEIKPIYGNEVYTDESPICKAAIHYGVLTDKEGVVDFMIEEGMSNYTFSNGFGIISQPYGSYVRSYRFLGARISLYHTYKELFEGNLFDKWENEKHQDVIESSDDTWSYYVENMVSSSSNVATQVKSIMHRGKIRSTSSINFASLLKLKGAEWSNGYILTSVMAFDPNPIGILFRYKDKYNYYGLILDFSKSESNVKLVAMVNSNFNTLMVKSFRLLLQTRFEVIIQTEFENMKIFLNNSNFNGYNNIITFKNSELQRGSMALATYGNSHFLIPGVEVAPQLPKKRDLTNGRTFTSILSKVKEKDKKEFCQYAFGTNKFKHDECLINQVFCSLLCQEIPEPENILRGDCEKQCIRAIKQKNNANLPFQSFTWLPREKTNVDFIPIGRKLYTSGYIISIETVGADKYVTVKYRSEFGNDEIDRQKYDGTNIKQCGSALPNRDDCDLI
jgi:hypothetical protein